MTVTAIESVTRHKMRVSLDGEPAFVFTDREIREWNLTEEMEFDRAEEEALVQYVCREAARTAMNLLVKRDYAQAELYRKLRERGYSEYFARQGIAYVSSYHYLDDERYVTRYLSTYQGRKSRRQMQFELERKGIPRELIRRGQEAMEDEEGCADETDMIRQLLEKRCRNPKEADEKEKRRHYGYLMRRGFTSSEIQSVFREYFSREE